MRKQKQIPISNPSEEEIIDGLTEENNPINSTIEETTSRIMKFLER